VAKVGKLLTLANFLDSGEFSASTNTKVIASLSVNFKFWFHDSAITTP
jgi:hypothetical protein